ncbi:T9SS type A sorting domain-containing protein [Brumimicrobium glaciale]|uniref:T9SS type A sorting domain-containing protein n=1 Tax=Brumimicrobium glaciale TaxID=200475 RepID=A0A4Q4KNB7_9FLAO|nr:T9SS type A sorting domain-containing protein [Brumimicrobium glaciale]RYM34933.1 T9SS type A sorting domain-containing protein [Brumimicrobium glaciale]
MKNKLIFSLLLLLFSSFGFSQEAVIEWQKSLGGSGQDEAKSVQQTTDGGYIITGLSYSNDGDVTVNNGYSDYWIVKLDAIGSISWQKSLGGSSSDIAWSIQQTSDGGYIVAGSSFSNDGDVTGNNGSSDYWVVKLDANGGTNWQKSLGGSGNDVAYSIQQTTDGGFIVAGSSSSNDGDITGNNGFIDYWVVKLDATGNINWQKSLGGSGQDKATSVQQTTDGGYIIAGFSYSNDGDLTVNNGGCDYWIIKLDTNGNIIWQKSIGGSGNDEAWSIQQTMDGGYIVGGYSNSNDGDVNGNYGAQDYWVVKLNTAGNITWQKSLGGSGYDRALSIHQTADKGYIIAGYSDSDDGNTTVSNGGQDSWIAKLNTIGNIIWQKSLGGSSSDIPWSIQQTSDGGYIIAGTSNSNDGDVTNNNGSFDYWIVKLEDIPNIFGKTYNDLNGNCIKESSEPSLSGMHLIINPGGYIAQINTNGMWYLDSLPIGTYTVTIDTTNLNWTPTCFASQTFIVTDPQIFTPGPNFGLINNNPCSSPEISIQAPFLRRCFNDQVIYVQACNKITATGVLSASYATVELDSLFTPTSSSLPYTSLGNNTYQFDLGDLNPGQCVSFTINTTISCNAFLGETLCMDAKLYPIDSCALDTIPPTPLPSNYGNNTNLVMPQPCTLPWDNSSLQVDGWCQGNSVQFSITNNGDLVNGDMECYAPIFLYVNDTLVSIDSVQLQGQETIYLSYPANGQTWILAAEQHPLHPGNSHPNAHVELCGSDSTQWISNMVNNFPLDDADPFVDIYCDVVTGSYDPNDKRGFPSGISDQNYVKPNQQLQYIVRFQNTGTDTAFTVVIRDTLDIDLNIFTVTPGASSHNYTFKKYGQRVLEWTFDHILLPDSTTNEPGSNGFVTFTVDQVPNLPNGTIINNQADIYFDFNSPIITNETVHRINDMIASSPLQVNEILLIEGNVIKVYPNPNSGMLFIELEKIVEPIDYKITNINGRIVSSGKLSQQKNKIDIRNLSTGLYLIHIDKSETIKIIKR